MRVSITKKQRKRYSNKGNSFIKQGLTTGFQLEDFNPKAKGKRIQYGHDSPSHISLIQQKIKGKRFPRESFYKWDPSWKAGINTKLLFKKTIAHEIGEYLSSPNVNKGSSFVKNNTIKGLKNAIKGSWDVPDVRLIGTKKRGYKDVFQVTKNIDSNSRLSMLIKSKQKLKIVKQKLKGEKVKKIQVQNYKNHSFYDFIS